MGRVLLAARRRQESSPRSPRQRAGRAREDAKLFQPFFTTKPVGRAPALVFSMLQHHQACGRTISYSETNGAAPGCQAATAGRNDHANDRPAVHGSIASNSTPTSAAPKQGARTQSPRSHLLLSDHREQPFDTGTLDQYPTSSTSLKTTMVMSFTSSSRGRDATIETGQKSTALSKGAAPRSHAAHTAQHVLSAFDRLFGVRTVSFHLSATSSTIDLAREMRSPDWSGRNAANRIVWENRPVSVLCSAEGKLPRCHCASRSAARSGWIASGTVCRMRGHACVSHQRNQRHRGYVLGTFQGRPARGIRLRTAGARAHAAAHRAARSAGLSVQARNCRMRSSACWPTREAAKGTDRAGRSPDFVPMNWRLARSPRRGASGSGGC